MFPESLDFSKKNRILRVAQVNFGYESDHSRLLRPFWRGGKARGDPGGIVASGGLRHNILWAAKKGSCFSAFFHAIWRLSPEKSCAIITVTDEICEELKDEL